MKLSRARVPAGWLLGVLVIALSRPTLQSLLLGLPLAVAGEAIRLWASGHIEKTRKLATGGPYAHTRNPLYVGSTLIALGVGVASASAWVVAAVFLYFLAFYPAVIREESGFLARTFGDDYAAWSREVPAFLPRLTPGGPRSSSFDWGRVRMNREWRTAAALPLLVLVLFARTLWMR